MSTQLGKIQCGKLDLVENVTRLGVSVQKKNKQAVNIFDILNLFIRSFTVTFGVEEEFKIRDD